jgi:GAF domain-containing protein
VPAQSAFTESLTALSRFFVGEGTFTDTLQRVAELTEAALEPVDFVGLTMLVENRARTAVFTDSTSPTIDQAQYDSGEGPCLDAFRQRRAVSVPSMTDDGPYPAFRAAAWAHGINSTLSLPLAADHDTVGAMNLYSRRRAAFGPDDLELAATFASQAAIVLANAAAYWDAFDLSSDLADALEHRAVIEQAKGILIGAQGCTPDEAFDLLVAASQRENVKLRVIAERMVEGSHQPRGPDVTSERPAST